MKEKEKQVMNIFILILFEDNLLTFRSHCIDSDSINIQLDLTIYHLLYLLIIRHLLIIFFISYVLTFIDTF